MRPRPMLLIYVDDQGLPAYEAVASRHSQVETRFARTPEQFQQDAPEADLICTARSYPRSAILSAKRARWLHVGGTGVDRLAPFADLNPWMVISNTPALNAEMMADWVICTLLMLVWDFPRLLRNQTARCWERWTVERVEGKTLVLVGLGNIAQPVIRRATAMGLRLVGVRRRPKPVEGVECVFGTERLNEALHQADFVLLAIPLTEQTQGLIGQDQFEAMKRTAYLINIGRGNVVQEPALVAALQEGKLAGAALDVFATEPLPSESALWTMPNVIISPHLSSWSTDYRERAAEVFAENLDRYITGKPLLHVIDREAGY